MRPARTCARQAVVILTPGGGYVVPWRAFARTVLRLDDMPSNETLLARIKAIRKHVEELADELARAKQGAKPADPRYGPGALLRRARSATSLLR